MLACTMHAPAKNGKSGATGKSAWSGNVNVSDMRKKVVGLAIDLQARAKVAASEVQSVASDKAVKVGKRLNEIQRNADKARVSAYRYVRYLTGSIVGVVSWTVGETVRQIKTKGVKTWAIDTAHATPEKARIAAKAAREKASRLAIATREMAKDKAFQATAASAAGGAVSLGTTGGAAGLATGTVIGAAVGLPMAFFTVGLSIPISAAIGGACGMVTGAAAGGTVGAVGAGAAGYGAYQKREEIASAVSSGRQQISDAASRTMASARESAAYVQEKAGLSAEFVRERASAFPSRVSSGSGRN